MDTLFLKPALGFTIDNLPDNLFSSVKQIDEGNDNGLQLQIEPSDVNDVVEILKANTTRHITTSRVGTVLYVDEDVTSELPPNQTVDGPIRDAAPEAQTAAPVLGDAHITPEPEMVDESDEIEEGMEEGMIDPQEIAEDKRIEGSVIHKSIATLLMDESVNHVKNVEDARIEFNKLWSKLIILKRDMLLAQSKIDGHPIIKKILDQIPQVDSHADVAEVYFTEKELVVITNELITAEKWDGAKRKIGKMRFGIGLTAFFSPQPNTNVEEIVSIKNLTQLYCDGCTIWECGHVTSDGCKCVGTAFEMLFDAFVNRDIEYIVETLIRFITEPNKDDSWGRHMNKWPEATESFIEVIGQ